MIRKETPGDIGEIRRINAAAFGQPTEGEIADSIRTACSEAASL